MEEEKDKNQDAREAPPGILARSALTDQTQPEGKGSFGFKGGLIAFVDWDDRVYVTPGTRLKLDLLEDVGFNNPRPQIDVPYSDDSLKSKRWLRRNLPENEIIRSVQENQSAKLDDIVKTGIMQVYKLGLKELEEEFLQERCALIEEKTYHFIGLCASYRGILSFTDWDANCFVTPYSDSKKYLLESRGYQYVESMIKVPYSLINEENCHWLAEHIPGGEWKRTEKEIKEDRIENGLIKAKKKIEDLGLEELPEELLSASAACEKNLTEDIGIAGSHNGILSFTDPMGVTRVTPATREKVELLKSLNYQFMGAAVRVPYSLKTESNIAWLRKNIAPEYWDTAKEANREELKKIEQEQTEKRRKYFGLKDLPDELLDNSIQTDQKEPAFTGSYYQRNGILAFVDPAQILFITPVTRKKKELLEEAGYKESPTGFRVPYSDGTPSDIEFIQMHLSGEEFESSRRDQEKEEEDINKKNIEKILSSAALDKLSRDILARSAKTSLREIELIGHYCSRGGVTCFIYEDGFFYVTMTVPWKEQALREAGYTVPEQLIRVPYGSGMEEDLLWLENNLPDEDMEKSRQELQDTQSEKEDKLALELLEQRPVSELPNEFLARCLSTEKVNAKLAGTYFQRFEMIFFVDSERMLNITPLTPGKLKTLTGASFLLQDNILQLPLCSGSEGNLNWINRNLPEGEIERSRQEIENLEHSKTEIQMKKNMEAFSLKQIPEDIYDRSADSGTLDSENIGRLGIYRGVLAFINPDKRVFVSWYTPDKQETLEECGYNTDGRLPIKVPYAMPETVQREWLMKNLPEPDEEELISVDENAE